jgi:hypothetical protein
MVIWNGELISRQDALSRGLKVYFTGKPCGKGHVCPRRVDNSNCVECSAVNQGRAYERRKAARPPKPPLLHKQLEQTVRALWGEGLGAKEIGRRLGRSKSSAAGIIWRLGLKRQQSPGLSQQVADLLTASPRPMTPSEIAQRLNKPRKQVDCALFHLHRRCDPPRVVRVGLGRYHQPVKAND